MKTWLIVLSVVAVLLAASTGVAFWMSMEAKAELAYMKADLMDTRAELTQTQEKLEEHFGYWWEESAGESWWLKYTRASPWRKKTAEETIHDLQIRVEELERADETPTYWWEKEQRETTKSEGYWWEEPSDQTARDLERRIQGLEAAVAALQSQVITLESTLQRHGIY